MLRSWTVVGLVLFCSACANSPGSSFNNGGSSSGGNNGASSGGNQGDEDASLLGSSSGGGNGSGSNCASGAGTFVYVISDANNLYSFDPTMFPAATAFAEIGPVTCDASGVNSMAVDRSATAWVNFNDGKIFKISTTAPVTCTPTSFMPGQGGFTDVLGMGFVADGVDASTETLYVSDNAGPGGTCMDQTPSPGCMGLGLGKIDTSSLTLTPIGAYTSTAAGYNAELTGTGDGRLFGFFTTTPASYGPIDVSTGGTSSPAPTSVPSVSIASGGYAFSFWGGDFYFYTAPTDTTIVTHLDSTTGMTTSSAELGFTIVGAGVSTCAPTTQPPPK